MTSRLVCVQLKFLNNAISYYQRRKVQSHQSELLSLSNKLTFYIYFLLFVDCVINHLTLFYPNSTFINFCLIREVNRSENWVSAYLDIRVADISKSPLE